MYLETHNEVNLRIIGYFIGMYTKGNIYSMSGVSWDGTNSYLGYSIRRKDKWEEERGVVSRKERVLLTPSVMLD